MSEQKIDSEHLAAAARALKDFANVHGFEAAVITVSVTDAGIHFATQLRNGVGKTEITVPFLLSPSAHRAAWEAKHLNKEST